MSDVRVAPTRRELRYEGFPLESVLARVHAAHGADVTITGADRVRRGGIGGFFAREVFQVTVVVDDPATEEAEPHFVSLGRIGIFGDDRPVVLDDAPDTYDDAGDFAFDTDDIDPEDVPGALGYAGSADRDPADAEIWALLAEAALAPDHGDAVEVVEPIRSVGPIASTTLIPGTPVATPATAAPAPAVPAPIPAVTLPATLPAPFVTSTSVVTSLPPSEEGVAAGAEDPVDLAELIARFEPAWCAPGLPAAGVIAVVGTRSDALPVAGALAACLGLAPDDVVVATPPADIVIPSPEDATRLAASTRFRCRPIAVIVVELVAGREGHEWARVVLEGLRPEQVRFAVDTSSLIAQRHRGIAAIGGVDVIDLLAAERHDDPAAALEAPAPIGTIDGRAATPEMWAATVLAARSRGRAHRPLRHDGSVVS